MTYVRTGMVLCAITALLGGDATASPILNVHQNLKTLGSTHDLSIDQLELLDSRSDSGWHLGWFKTDPQDVSLDTLTVEDSLTNALFPDGGNNVIGLIPGIDVTNANGSAVQGLNTTDAVTGPVAVVPEPTSLILLGSGVAAMIAKARNRRNDEPIA